MSSFPEFPPAGDVWAGLNPEKDAEEVARKKTAWEEARRKAKEKGYFSLADVPGLTTRERLNATSRRIEDAKQWDDMY